MPARCVGQDDGANSHAPEHAHGKRDLLCRISLVKMHAALHHGHRDGARLSDHHLSSVADCGGSRECRNVSVRDALRVGERIGKPAETGTQHQTNSRTQGSSSKNDLCGGFCGGINIVSHAQGRQYFFSNFANSPSSFHCIRARSLAARNCSHPAEGFSAPAASLAHAGEIRNTSFVSAHRL